VSYMKKLPSNPTRDQLVAWKIQNGECGLLRADWTAPCPRRNGPVNPSPDHPVSLLIVLPVWQGYVSNLLARCSSLRDGSINRIDQPTQFVKRIEPRFSCFGHEEGPLDLEQIGNKLHGGVLALRVDGEYSLPDFGT
jgi:hypothetical protein